MRKPVRVWRVQAPALPAAAGGTLVLTLTLEALAPIGRSGHADVRFLMEAAIAAGVIMCAGFALAGSRRRRADGRWCGLALMACIALKRGQIHADGLPAMSDDVDHAGLTVDDVPMLVVAAATTAVALSPGWSCGFPRRCRAWLRVARTVS